MFYLYELANVIPGVDIVGNKDITWQYISIDSRTIKKGELFIALKGERYDGHNFIREACQKGAAAVMMEKGFFQKHPSICEEVGHTLLLVENTVQALQLWAHYYHSLFSPLDICITGSNGKTTTKEMIAQVLSTNYQVWKSQGNHNNEIGVPLSILGLTSDHKVIVLEMAAQKTGEIRELVKIVNPDIAVITNIGDAHIGLFGNQDNIAREKSELILALKDKGTAILNRDDTYYDYLANSIPKHCETISFGFHPRAQVQANHFCQKGDRSLQFELSLEGKRNSFPIFLPLLGKFNVLNALAAIAVGLKLEIPMQEIISNISNFKGTDWHMEFLMLGKGVTLVQDYYNANPTAIREALQSVAGIARGRFKIAILGDMLELGDSTIDFHKEAGREAASLFYDMLIAIGEYGKYIIEGAREEGMAKEKVHYFEKEEKEKAAYWLYKTIPANSILLMKGSRGMMMEEIVQYWKERIRSEG